MKKFVFTALALLLASCTPKVEVVEIYQGPPGTSCSVAPEVVSNEQYESLSEVVIGARISCTDGSFSIIYNGEAGSTGATGSQGPQGIPGIDGDDGQSCSAYRSHFFDGVWLSCPNQWPVLIADGEDGRDGASCSSVRQSNRVKITCGSGHNQSVSYVYDGEAGEDGKDGKDGKSCTATRVAGGINVKCGNNSPVFLADGSNGADGEDGSDGINGTNGLDAFTPGMSCDVYDIASWDGNSSLPAMFVGANLKGNFTLANFSVPDSQSSAGFPGMPAALQNKVGLEGYALDCAGYLNVPTSGDYVFKLLSDDGSELRIEDNLIIANQGLHAPATVTSATTRLNKGPNRINVVYYQGPHTQIALELKWKGPNLSEAIVPASKLTH